MKLKMTMNPTSQLEPTDEPPLGDQESDFDDDDRRELISHYANEKYLSKWEVADDAEATQEKSDHTLHVHVPSSSKHELQEKETDNNKTEGDHLVATVDCDDMSLVSYNSIRDCTPSATPRTVPMLQSHPGQLPQSADHDLKVFGHSLQLWQGYGGNIYFDAVRCQSMRINSARKPGNTRKGDIAKRWKSKSCYPMNRREEQQAHTTCILSTPGDAPTTSTHSLGSLRMKSCREKKCWTASCRHKDTNRPLPGNICKGLSEKLLTETFQKFQENRGYSLSKEPLAVSGGQVRDLVLDPIDKVQQFNMQDGFPALLTDSSFFSHQGAKKGLSVVSSDTDPFIKLPLLGKHGGKQNASKADAGGSDDGSKPANEPRPVFIIPFGAFDDPVDGDSDLKRKMPAKKEKTSSRNSGDGADESLGNIKEIKEQSEGLESSLAISSNDNNNNNLETAICRDEDNDGIAKHQVTITSSVGHGKPLRQGVPDFHLKREISNLSLSNYLRAVPTRGSKEQKRLTSPHQSAVMPKMSYTKRSRALPTFYMVNNSLHRVHHSGFNQRMNGSHVYGGYFPTTGRKESELFYAEISTCPEEQNSGNSESSTRDSSRRTKSSVSNRTSSNSPRLPKHALLKATYVSRNSFTRQSAERSTRANETLGNAGDKLLPVTGLQISKFNGIHDR